MNPAVKRSGETPLAVFIGGTGRYTSSGHLLSGLNVGYGRFLDGLAHHGIDNFRYNRFTHFFSRAISDIQQLEHEFGALGQWVRAIVFEELGHFLKYRDSDPAQVRKVMEFDRDVADLILSMPRPIPDHEQ